MQNILEIQAHLGLAALGQAVSFSPQHMCVCVCVSVCVCMHIRRVWEYLASGTSICTPGLASVMKALAWDEHRQALPPQ